MTYATGSILWEKRNGWKLFCERIGVPPYLLWEGLPGYDRLMQTLELSETMAFSRNDLLSWLNRTTPPGEGEPEKDVITGRDLADSCESMYREQVKWWGGE